jgi:hypothetical protein
LDAVGHADRDRQRARRAADLLTRLVPEAPPPLAPVPCGSPAPSRRRPSGVGRTCQRGGLASRRRRADPGAFRHTPRPRASDRRRADSRMRSGGPSRGARGAICIDRKIQQAGWPRPGRTRQDRAPGAWPCLSETRATLAERPVIRRAPAEGPLMVGSCTRCMAKSGFCAPDALNRRGSAAAEGNPRADEGGSCPTDLGRSGTTGWCRGDRLPAR